MRLVEGVVLRGLGVLPELLRDARRDAVLRAALEELVLEGRHQLVDLLADRLAQIVGLGGREAGELLGDLHVLLLVDRDAVGQPVIGFSRGSMNETGSWPFLRRA